MRGFSLRMIQTQDSDQEFHIFLQIKIVVDMYYMIASL